MAESRNIELVDKYLSLDQSIGVLVDAVRSVDISETLKNELREAAFRLEKILDETAPIYRRLEMQKDFEIEPEDKQVKELAMSYKLNGRLNRILDEISSIMQKAQTQLSEEEYDEIIDTIDKVRADQTSTEPVLPKKPVKPLEKGSLSTLKKIHADAKASTDEKHDSDEIDWDNIQARRSGATVYGEDQKAASSSDPGSATEEEIDWDNVQPRKSSATVYSQEEEKKAVSTKDSSDDEIDWDNIEARRPSKTITDDEKSEKSGTPAKNNASTDTSQDQQKLNSLKKELTQLEAQLAAQDTVSVKQKIEFWNNQASRKETSNQGLFPKAESKVDKEEIHKKIAKLKEQIKPLESKIARKISDDKRKEKQKTIYSIPEKRRKKSSRKFEEVREEMTIEKLRANSARRGPKK